MKFGKTLASTGALAAALVLSALPVAAVAAPGLTIQSEEAAHPRIVAAIHEMKHALEEMEAAPDDFGGNKAAAIHDTRVALHSLRKALYFRLHMDDAAIDRVN
jgi:hypothetical protein